MSEDPKVGCDFSARVKAAGLFAEGRGCKSVAVMRASRSDATPVALQTLRRAAFCASALREADVFGLAFAAARSTDSSPCVVERAFLYYAAIY